jgi:hypothetical protein
MEDKYIEKNKVKVCLTLVDDRTLWGYVFVSSFERVSDVLNDDKQFIPFHVLEDRTGRQYDDVYKLIFVNKSRIYRAEE